MFKQEAQTSPPTEPSPNSGGTLDDPQLVAKRQAAEVLAQWAVRKYLALEGGSNDEEGETKDDQVQVSPPASDRVPPLPAPSSGEDNPG